MWIYVGWEGTYWERCLGCNTRIWWYHWGQWRCVPWRNNKRMWRSPYLLQTFPCCEKCWGKCSCILWGVCIPGLHGQENIRPYDAHCRKASRLVKRDISGAHYAIGLPVFRFSWRCYIQRVVVYWDCLHRPRIQREGNFQSIDILLYRRREKPWAATEPAASRRRKYICIECVFKIRI